MRQIYSAIDESINVILDTPKGKFEARWVHRPGADYALIYLSSHAGCAQACRMCHLTATGQTSQTPATVDDYVQQAIAVLRAISHVPAGVKRVDFAFMAQGDPLMNPAVVEDWPRLASALAITLWPLKMEESPYFKISTIYPTDFKGTIVKVFGSDGQVVVYYSLYTMNNDFRKRWLPKSRNPAHALCDIADWQWKTGNDVVIHGAFIEGQNDSIESVESMLNCIHLEWLKPRFNLVRYNPPNDKSKETSPEQLERIRQTIATRMPCRMVERVGFDVAASCGMFMTGDPS